MRLPLTENQSRLESVASAAPVAAASTPRAEGGDAPPLKASARRVAAPWRRLRVGLGLALTLAAVVGLAVVPGAWRATERREAYLPELEAMAQQAPYDGRLLALLGGRQLEAKQFVTAAATLERAGAAGENTAAVWICLAGAKAASGDSKALAYLKLGQRNLQSAELTAALGRAQALPRQSSGPVLAAAISPDGAGPLISAYAGGSLLNGLAEWWGRGHPEASGFSTRQTWANEQPDNAEAQRLWGLALLENSRPREAATPLQRAVQLEPNSAAAHFALATLLETQTPANASLEYITCLKLRPAWVPALLGLGRVSMEESLVRTAADVYGAATRLAPTSADAWIGLGEADVAATHDRDIALKAFQTAARLAPARTDYLTSYAVALRQNGQWPQAEAMARRGIAANPGNDHGYYILAGILRDYQPSPARLTEALGQTQIALRLAPESGEIKLLLASLLLRQGKPHEAIRWLQQVIKVAPDNVNALLTLARADRLAGLDGEAQKIAARAVAVYQYKDQMDMINGRLQANPSDIGAHLALADLYARIARPAQAQQERQVANMLRRDPSRARQSMRTMASLIEEVLPHP